ncbi:MAG: hypothetical protein MPN21_16575 [Thermoanaerobaculia bacterium]|nr:hypothetical protein [Thermoanaerobaculia bacterium]
MIVTYVMRRCFLTVIFMMSLCFCSISAAQIPHVIRPDLDPPGAEPVAEGETPQLTRGEEKRLLQQILWQPEETWDAATQRAMERLLGKGRVRRLDEARFQLHLAADDWDLRDLNDDPYHYERTKDAVLSSYLKIQREVLEEAFRVEERFDAWLDRVSRRDPAPRRGLRETYRGVRSFRLRISPRVGLGSSDYLGVKLRMPYTGFPTLDRLSLRVRHEFDEDRSSFLVKYDSDDLFLQLEIEPDLELEGDQVSLSLRLTF